MVRIEARVAHVQKLRFLAKVAGVDPVLKDDVSRTMVMQMVGKVRLSEAPAATLQEIEQEFASCQRTFDTTAVATGFLSVSLSLSGPVVGERTVDMHTGATKVVANAPES